MTQIISGHKIAREILNELKKEIIKLKSAGITPRLVIILVGGHPASLAYVKAKEKKAKEISLSVQVIRFSETVSESELVERIQYSNKEPAVCGIIVQLPLPDHIRRGVVLDTISPDLDVDCLTIACQSDLAEGNSKFLPPAAAAILQILEYHQIELRHKSVLLIGSGELVGKPLSVLLRQRGVDFELANSSTKNLAELSLRADVIITGVGKTGLLTGEMIRAGAVVIDAGTAASEAGEIKGDVELHSVSRKASLVAPVPGGVGLVTIAMLFRNVMVAANKKIM